MKADGSTPSTSARRDTTSRLLGAWPRSICPSVFLVVLAQNGAILLWPLLWPSGPRNYAISCGICAACWLQSRADPRRESLTAHDVGASFGRRSQRGGREFEPPAVHQLSLTILSIPPTHHRSLIARVLVLCSPETSRGLPASWLRADACNRSSIRVELWPLIAITCNRRGPV
jgi:hypothetical protein